MKSVDLIFVLSFIKRGMTEGKKVLHLFSTPNADLNNNETLLMFDTQKEDKANGSWIKHGGLDNYQSEFWPILWILVNTSIIFVLSFNKRAMAQENLFLPV